jgi:hypothetical protein
MNKHRATSLTNKPNSQIHIIVIEALTLLYITLSNDIYIYNIKKIIIIIIYMHMVLVFRF